MLEREMLLVSRIARTATSIGFGGQKVNTQTVRWQRHNDDVLLRIVSYVNVADDSLAISAAVENANFEPIVKSFDIEAFNEDSSAIVIEVTPLYATDVPVLGLQSQRRTQYGVRRLDRSRSFPSSTKSFARNIEVRSVLTYEATKAPSNASTGTVSLEMNHSMILLPDEPMQPRLWDDRVGFFSFTQNDYGRDEQRALSAGTSSAGVSSRAIPRRGPAANWWIPSSRSCITSTPPHRKMAPLPQARDRGLATGFRAGRIQKSHHRSGSPHARGRPRVQPGGRPLLGDTLLPGHDPERLPVPTCTIRAPGKSWRATSIGTTT